MFLNDDEKQAIDQAIKTVESKSSGELVAVIARASDDYLYIPLLWAALLSLLTPGILYYFLAQSGGLPETCPDWGWWLFCDAVDVYLVQLAMFALLAVVFRWQPVKLLLVPGRVKKQRAHRHAYQQFFHQGLHETEARNGILIFVSIAEHYVEIIADQGVNDQTEPALWQAIVEKFVEAIRSNRIADGYLQAINACGEILIQQFPKKAANGSSNQLPDHLIEIE